jgi:hypothetical protein
VCWTFRVRDMSESMEPVCPHGVHPAQACTNRMCRLERERDELREAIQAAMLECDHLILRWPSNPYEWQIGVSKIQENMRILLARLARIDAAGGVT